MSLKLQKFLNEINSENSQWEFLEDHSDSNHKVFRNKETQQLMGIWYHVYYGPKNYSIFTKINKLLDFFKK